jgi:hypothetical protein
VLSVLVHLPFLPQRAVCLPVLARLWRPKHPDRTKLRLACALVTLALTAVAIAQGSQFWFQLLNRFVNLRLTGQPPPKEEQPAEPA